MSRLAFVGLSVVALVLATQINGAAQRSSLLHVQATSAGDLRAWDTYITQRTRSGDLRVRQVERDALLPSRTIERLQQFHRGVLIWGAEGVRDSERGLTLSIFGVLSPDLALSVDPSLSVEQRRPRLMKLGGAEAVLLAVPTTVTAATIDSYELHYYMAGASQPFQLFALPSGSYQCNQLPNPNTRVANPTMAEWDDPDASGRVCRYVEVPGGLLFSFPAGTYEATIRGFNSYGVSPESNRAVFCLGRTTRRNTVQNCRVK